MAHGDGSEQSWGDGRGAGAWATPSFWQAGWFGHWGLSPAIVAGEGPPQPTRVTERCQGDFTPGPTQWEGLVMEINKVCFFSACPQADVRKKKSKFGLAGLASLKMLKTGFFCPRGEIFQILTSHPSCPSASELGFRRTLDHMFLYKRCWFIEPRHYGCFNEAGYRPQGEAEHVGPLMCRCCCHLKGSLKWHYTIEST